MGLLLLLTANVKSILWLRGNFLGSPFLSCEHQVTASRWLFWKHSIHWAAFPGNWSVCVCACVCEREREREREKEREREGGGKNMCVGVYGSIYVWICLHSWMWMCICMNTCECVSLCVNVYIHYLGLYIPCWILRDSSGESYSNNIAVD